MSPDSRDLPIATRWWHSERVSERVTRIWEPHVTPLLRCNIWHVRGTKRDLLVDTGLGVAPLRAAFPDLFGREPIVVATHSHQDHVGGLHEFQDRRGHPLEAASVIDPPPGGLLAADITPHETSHLLEVGYDVPPVFIDALPRAGFDPARYQTVPAPFTDVLEADHVIDLGGGVLRVVHLPGHTPGSIGLFDEGSGVLFSGDAIYDGPLLDGLPESDPDAYVATMRRLLELPVRMVYPGHDGVFDAARLAELATHYIDSNTGNPAAGRGHEPLHEGDQSHDASRS